MSPWDALDEVYIEQLEAEVATLTRKLAKADRAAESAQTRQPDRIQEMTARSVGEMMGVEIDPLSVRDLGYEHPYYVAEVDVAGVTFIGRYLSDTNGLHRVSAPWTVEKRGRVRRQTREVDRIGDLAGWL